MTAALGPGGIAFVESDEFQANFCSHCPAHGDEDKCPCGLSLGDVACWKSTEWRELVEALADIELCAVLSGEVPDD
jgi:hypothetical protein